VKTLSALSSAPGSRRGCVESDKKYKNHVSAPTEASGPASHAAGSSASGTSTVPKKRKRETVASSNFLASSDAEDDADDSVLTGCTNNLGAHNDELDEYTWPCRRLRTQRRVLVSGVIALVL
jgi:hypothetical protein